ARDVPGEIFFWRGGLQQGGDLHARLDDTGLAQMHLAVVLADEGVTDSEIDQVAVALGDVAPAVRERFAPAIIAELARYPEVRAAVADAIAAEAGKVRLARGARTEAAVE